MVFRILPMVLASALAGPGCARCRGQAEPVPAGRAVVDVAAEEVRPDAGEGGGGETNGASRVKVDADRVEALQNKAIQQQRGGKRQCLLRRRTRFTRWLDQAHETWYRRMDNAVRTVDVKWLSESSSYDPELSTFRLKTLARAGGRSREKDTEIKVYFRGDLALPGLEDRLHLILENADKESLPGSDPMRQADDTRLGLRTIWNSLEDNELEIGGGLKWRHSNPVAYAELEWRGERRLGDGKMRLCPRAFYFSDEGFGQMTTFSWTKPVGERKFFQIRTAERSSEGTDFVEFEQSFRFAWLRSGKGRGWVAQASIFPHLASSDWSWDDSLVNLTWRDALYRKWIYYTITPQVQFPKEDEYQARPSIRIGLEILFGGKIGDLI